MLYPELTLIRFYKNKIKNIRFNTNKKSAKQIPPIFFVFIKLYSPRLFLAFSKVCCAIGRVLAAPSCNFDSSSSRCDI